MRQVSRVVDGRIGGYCSRSGDTGVLSWRVLCFFFLFSRYFTSPCGHSATKTLGRDGYFLLYRTEHSRERPLLISPPTWV